MCGRPSWFQNTSRSGPVARERRPPCGCGRKERVVEKITRQQRQQKKTCYIFLYRVSFHVTFRLIELKNKIPFKNPPKRVELTNKKTWTTSHKKSQFVSSDFVRYVPTFNTHSNPWHPVTVVDITLASDKKKANKTTSQCYAEVDSSTCKLTLSRINRLSGVQTTRHQFPFQAHDSYQKVWRYNKKISAHKKERNLGSCLKAC